jgi:lipopolysaccharide biosynthesis regulator YciM
MRPKLFHIVILMLVAIFLGWGAEHANAALPAVEGSVKRDFARIVFAWPERVPFRAQMDGRTLKVTFERQANPNLGALRSTLGPYVESATMAADGKTALITLKHPYPVRTFISDTSSGIDLLQINSPRFQGKSPTPAPPQMAAATPAAGPIPAPVSPPKPAALATKQPFVAKPALKPSAPPAITKSVSATVQSKPPAVQKPTPPDQVKEAKTASPKATIPPAAKIAETTKEVSQSSPVTEAEPSSSTLVENTPNVAAEVPAAAESSLAEAAPAVAKEAPLIKTEIAAPAGGNGLMVAVQKKSIAADFTFPWKERVAAAGFTYGQEFWVVFSKPAKVDVTSLLSVAPSYITGIEQLPITNATILRFTLNEDMSPTVRKAANNYEWTFTLSRRNRIPAFPLVAETRTEPPLKPHVFLDILEAAQPLQITHPHTAEDMVILPIYKGGQGVFPERQFVDARLPRTAQGLLVIKNAEAVRVAKLRNGVRISSVDGLKLASTLPALDLKAYVSEEESGDTFFPYEKWKTEDADDFAAREQSIRRAISEASDPQASRLRKKLAELYLGDGLFLESLAVLNLIRSTDPDYYRDHQLAALRGASNFMAQRLQEAALDFNDPALEGSDEINFWKRISAVMNGQENKLIKYAEFNDLYARHYPPEMRRQLVLIAGDQAIGQGMYDSAINILKSLPQEDMAPIAAYRDFMIARIYSESGKYKQADEMLTKLLDQENNRFIRARALFTQATNRFKAGEIDKEELLKQLDALRIVWRGDQLELSLLDLLGNLYVSEKRYIEGLRAWKELATSYPGTPLAQSTSLKMAQTFSELFKEGFAKELPPLAALSLFYEFKDLTPIGTDGDRMIQELADRLASVDLLDRAEALLEHQIVYRLEKEDRSRVGARLALIYLLDKKPQQAIQVLELTGYGNNPPDLQAQRNRLAAEAYAVTGDWKTALSMLEKDFSQEAKLIQMDILWDNKDWPAIIAMGEDMLASRTNITAAMNDNEAQTLMRLAVAYTMEGDRLQLQYLRDYFTPLMAKSAYKESFDFITDDKGPIDTNNLQQLASEISKARSFIGSYRASVNERGLSPAIN